MNVGNQISQNATDIANNATRTGESFANAQRELDNLEEDLGNDIANNEAAIRGVDDRTDNFSENVSTGGTTHNGDLTIGTDYHLDFSNPNPSEGNLTVNGNTTLGNSASDTTTINGGAQISGGGLTIGDQGDFDAGIAGDWQTLTINGNTVTMET